jgi:phosphotransferase system HPr (HPr) family protein
MRARREVVIGAREGLHARPASRLVEAAGRFESSIELVHEGRRVSAKKILDVLVLGAPAGSRVVVEAEGPDAQAAADAVAALLADRA